MSYFIFGAVKYSELNNKENQTIDTNHELNIFLGTNFPNSKLVIELLNEIIGRNHPTIPYLVTRTEKEDTSDSLLDDSEKKGVITIQTKTVFKGIQNTINNFFKDDLVKEVFMGISEGFDVKENFHIECILVEDLSAKIEKHFKEKCDFHGVFFTFKR